jgi:hypothetical protein
MIFTFRVWIFGNLVIFLMHVTRAYLEMFQFSNNIKKTAFGIFGYEKSIDGILLGIYTCKVGEI